MSCVYMEYKQRLKVLIKENDNFTQWIFRKLDKVISMSVINNEAFSILP